MWELIRLPEKRLDDREFNLRNCTSCAYCEVCNGVRTRKNECTNCMDCWAEGAGEEDPIPCERCAICEGDLRFVDCYECEICEECKLLMDEMKPPKLKGHSAVVAS